MSIYALSVCRYDTIMHFLCLQKAPIYEIGEYIFEDSFKIYYQQNWILKKDFYLSLKVGY